MRNPDDLPCSKCGDRDRVPRTPYCKRCKNERERVNRIKRRRRCLDAYGGVCVCCGEDTEEFLAFDYVNGDGKEHRAAIGGSAVYGWLIRNDFPPVVRILCHNCRGAVSYYGYCPHNPDRLQQHYPTIHDFDHDAWEQNR